MAAESDTGSVSEMVTVDGIVFPAVKLNIETLRKIQEGYVPDFDVLVATFPKTGTQRLLELVWLLTHNFDFQVAGTTALQDRRFNLEFSLPDFSNALPVVPPKLARSHLPFSFLSKALSNKRPKVIVGMRNPKDVLVSYFHLYRATNILGHFKGSWDEFFQMYCEGKTCMGDMFDHFLGWWQKRHEHNILIVKFEDFTEKGAEKVIEEVAQFLGVKPDHDTIADIAKWISFESMKKNPMTNFTRIVPGQPEHVDQDISPYMRKGTTGDWVNYFSPEQNAYIDKLYEERCVPEGLTFTFK